MNSGMALPEPGARLPERPRRPREMQDPLNFYFYHPLAWQLARRLAKTPVTPNMVSVFGGLMVVSAGLAYWGLAWPLGPALGMALHMSWHVVDGADGDLARLTGRSSPLGELVDGICDYASHVVLYVLLAFVLTRTMGAGWAWFFTLSAGASHVVQSNHVEVQRRFYQYWIHGVPWLNNAWSADEDLFRDQQGLRARIFRGFVDGYLRLATGLTPYTHKVDAAVTAAQKDPARLAAIRAEVTRENRPLLLLLKFLGPNPRAIVLGVSMFAGTPLWYFLYQVVVLNTLLLVSVQLHNRAARRVASRLSARGLLPA